MPKPKLTQKDCADIRRMYADRAHNVGPTSLAHLFRVSAGTVNRVLNNVYVTFEDYEEKLEAKRADRKGTIT